MVTPSTPVAIRGAATSDAKAIATIHLASWRAAYRGIVPDQFLIGITLESRIARWQRALSLSESPLVVTTVAVNGDAILGVCSSGPRQWPESSSFGEIYALHVEPGSWRRGIGRLLLDDSLERLAARGFAAAVLWVLRDNWNARRFYEARGWSITGEEMVEERDGYAIPETRYAISLAS
jgi:ribosomal protein S18 acetylase RimI-like enzyme